MCRSLCPACPSCRTEIDRSNLHRNKAIDRLINSIPVPCAHRIRGCLATTTRADYSIHIESCSMKEAPLLDTDPLILLAKARTNDDPQLSVTMLKQAANIAIASGGHHSPIVPEVYISLSNLYLELGQTRDATSAAQDAIRCLRPLPKTTQIVDALYHLGEAFRREGKLADATVAFMEAVNTGRSLDPKCKIASKCEKGLALIDKKLDDVDGALVHYTQALLLADESEKEVIASLIIEQADLMYRRSAIDALSKYSEALDVLNGDPTLSTADASCGKARCLLDIGNNVDTMLLVKTAERIYYSLLRSMDDPRFALIKYLEGRSLALSGDFAKAIELYTTIKLERDHAGISLADINLSIAEAVAQMVDSRKPGYRDHIATGIRCAEEAKAILDKDDIRVGQADTLLFLLREGN